MPNWVTELYLYDLHRSFRDKTITVEELGRGVAERLEKNRYASELKDVIEAFKDCHNVEEYDDVLDTLYSFADEGHRIWVNALVKRGGRFET